MKIALTFLTISVVLLLGSTMWGMKTYTDLAHARSDVADLKQELERYRSGTAASYPVAMPGVVAQTQPQQPAPAQITPAPPTVPALDEAEIEARLEEMIAERMGVSTPPAQDPAPAVDPVEQELKMLEMESSAIDRERQSLMSERESIDAGPLLTDGQNKIATAPILAKVTEANAQYSFVVMDAGGNKNLSVGDTYSIRRNHMIIGEAVIDTVEPSEAVANVKPSSIPTGIVIRKGDHVVEYVGRAGS